MDKFLNSEYWEERDLNLFSLFMALVSFVIIHNFILDIESIIMTIIAYIVSVIIFFIVLLLSHFLVNSLLDYINNMGESKVIVKFLGFILIAIDLLIFICIIFWSIYEAFNTGEYIVLIIIPIYYFVYYFLLSSPIGSVGNWLFNNIKINSDKKDLKGEV